jgi:hypothetical protein
MSPATTPLEGAVIVLEGSINPAIFNPAWLLAVGLVNEKEATSVDPRFIDPELSRFQIAGKAIEARRDQLTVASTPDLPSFHAIGDFAQEMLTLLPHTPIFAIGMNRVLHQPMSGSTFRTLSELLAPPDIWNSTGLLAAPSIQTITMTEPGDDSGSIEMTVEPSTVVTPGVYVIATRKFRASKTTLERNPGAEWARAQIAEHWHPWIERGGEAIKSLVALAGP